MPPLKQTELNELIAQVKKLIGVTTDLTRQVSRLIGVSNSVVERYARGYEEIDALRLAQEEFRELLADHFAENARFVDVLAKSLRELQRYIILIRATGGNQETLQIESRFTKAQIEDALKEDLASQRDLQIRYQKNLNKVRERVARFGETTRDMNEIEGYEAELSKAESRIEHLTRALKTLDEAKSD